MTTRRVEQDILTIHGRKRTENVAGPVGKVGRPARADAGWTDPKAERLHNLEVEAKEKK